MSTFDEQQPRPGGAHARAVGDTPGVEELEHEVARTREQLGDTVDALSAKLDVPTRASRQVEAGRDKVRQAALRTHRAVTDEHGRPVPAVWIGAGTALAAAVGLVLLERARR